jgi:HD-GYP domain-containing protein (c-di-GMP phosphodiesterase class II)
LARCERVLEAGRCSLIILQISALKAGAIFASASRSLATISSMPSRFPSTRHSIHVATIATIAMAIAVEMGLSRDQIVDLGIGCLVHDIGMQTTGAKMFQTKSKLSRTALGHLADHPVHAAELAGQLGDTISNPTKLAAYQMHERGDGSGYPRGLQAPQIHTLSRCGVETTSRGDPRLLT